MPRFFLRSIRLFLWRVVVEVRVDSLLHGIVVHVRLTEWNHRERVLLSRFIRVELMVVEHVWNVAWFKSFSALPSSTHRTWLTTYVIALLFNLPSELYSFPEGGSLLLPDHSLDSVHTYLFSRVELFPWRSWVMCWIHGVFLFVDHLGQDVLVLVDYPVFVDQVLQVNTRVLPLIAYSR